MANTSMEIGFIMAAMKESKPSTTFVFPTWASNQKRQTPAKQIPLSKDEHRYSTDSESSLKGRILHIPCPCSCSICEVGKTIHTNMIQLVQTR